MAGQTSVIFYIVDKSSFILILIGIEFTAKYKIKALKALKAWAS